MDEPNTMERLPCGCRHGTDEVTEAFIYEPCSMDCEFYLYVLEESKRQGKPTVTLDAR